MGLCTVKLVMIMGSILVMTPLKADSEDPVCTCGGASPGAQTYKPDYDDDCKTFTQYIEPGEPTGPYLPCPSGLIFDIASCSCNFGWAATCNPECTDPVCEESTCNSNGECIETKEGDPRCLCDPGYSGNSCAVDVDDCSGDPCGNGGTCIDGVNSYSCNCVAAWTGSNCAQDVTECTVSTCNGNGVCVEEVDGGTTCECTDGFTGSSCETDINYCDSTPCSNGGTCHEEDTTFSCTCSGAYTGVACGEDITECTHSTCNGNGECVEEVDGGTTCECTDGFTGSSCETDINYCDSTPCSNGGTCHEEDTTFSCTCSAAYTGVACGEDITECTHSTCNGNGECVEEVDGGTTCECTDGFTGSSCETDINYCDSTPCSNGGTCHEEDTTFSCTCSGAYTGVACGEDITECTHSTCNGNGECVEEVDGGTTCECTDGFTGSSCETDINYCDSTPCSNGGTCHEEDTTFSCTCSGAYTGVACGEEMNECAGSPCTDPNSYCVDSVGSFECLCSKGYYSVNGLCTDVNECTSFGNADVCSELNAECTNTVGGFTCDTCRRGFEPDGTDGDCSCIESESGFGTCYIYVDTPTPWAEAREDCLDAGGDLVVMSSPEQGRFDALTAARNTDGRTTVFYWIGGQQATIKTNTWEWVDGSSFSPSSPLWINNEPNDFNKNKIACLTSPPATFGSLSTFYNLYDFRCEAASPYVCEVPVDTP